MPRWDLKAIPGLGNTAKWRKRKESGPVRWLYEAVRSGKVWTLCTLSFGRLTNDDDDPNRPLRTRIQHLQIEDDVS